jgi:hypothetical protein
VDPPARASDQRIVTARGDVRGFSSAEDLGHALYLDPAVVDALRERGVFLPA